MVHHKTAHEQSPYTYVNTGFHSVLRNGTEHTSSAESPRDVVAFKTNISKKVIF
jgi:hypothetical protein